MSFDIYIYIILNNTITTNMAFWIIDTLKPYYIGLMARLFTLMTYINRPLHDKILRLRLKMPRAIIGNYILIIIGHLLIFTILIFILPYLSLPYLLLHLYHIVSYIVDICLPLYFHWCYIYCHLIYYILCHYCHIFI